MRDKGAFGNGVPLFLFIHGTLFFIATLQRREKYSVLETVVNWPFFGVGTNHLELDYLFSTKEK